MPADTPVTIPVVPIVASALLQLHVPPAVPLDASEILLPIATLTGPEMVPALGVAVTVTIAVILQPVAASVNVIVGMLACTPVTRPVDEPTVAKPELLLLHVPLPETSDNNVAEPVHTLSAPLIAAGDAITVTICVAMQPVDIL